MQKRQKCRKKKERKKEREKEEEEEEEAEEMEMQAHGLPSISPRLRSFNNGCKGNFYFILFEGVPNFFFFLRGTP